jgi:hypothetical protein
LAIPFKENFLIGMAEFGRLSLDSQACRELPTQKSKHFKPMPQLKGHKHALNLGEYAQKKAWANLKKSIGILTCGNGTEASYFFALSSS